MTAFQRSDKNHQTTIPTIKGYNAWWIAPWYTHDPKDWDEYWKNHIRHGCPRVIDGMISDTELVRQAKRYKLTKILCVGNGTSQEPAALAKAGFEVTAMDISPSAIEFCNQYASALESPKAFFDPQLQCSGGSASFVVGDIFRSSDCPGPFDIIIERRFIENYSEPDREKAVLKLVDRLANPGILLSHCHDTRYNPRKQPDSIPEHKTRVHLERAGLSSVYFTDWPGLLSDWPQELQGQISFIVSTSG